MKGVFEVAMTEEAREMRREYRREWAKKNRDKVRAAQERYWEKKVAQQAERTQQA